MNDAVISVHAYERLVERRKEIRPSKFCKETLEKGVWYRKPWLSKKGDVEYLVHSGRGYLIVLQKGKEYRITTYTNSKPTSWIGLIDREEVKKKKNKGKFNVKVSEGVNCLRINYNACRQEINDSFMNLDSEDREKLGMLADKVSKKFKKD